MPRPQPPCQEAYPPRKRPRRERSPSEPSGSNSAGPARPVPYAPTALNRHPPPPVRDHPRRY